ncbi:MAG: glycosyltransferase family 4 protein [Gemmataceae bacterium]|nr:glycosyltransferase family 4 protein [Gemmataceae bacterium]
MRIGIELLQVEEGISGGIAPLLQGVVAALLRHWPEHDVTLFCTPTNRQLFDGGRGAVHVWELPPSWCFELLDAHANCLNLDVLLRSYPCDRAMSFPHARQIVLIPDLQHEYFPEFFAAATLAQRRAGFRHALANAGAVATLTEHSRQTLRQHAPRAPGHEPDIFLMPPALRAAGRSASEDDLTPAERAVVPAGDFFLYPANLWPHKNHRRVLEAFRLFLKAAPRPFEFVFTGHPEGWPALASDFADLPIRHPGFVRAELLQVLLRRARALIFFSLFEGFGMPLLEAFAAGTPAACSNTSSLPEVAGDAALLCDPTDPDAMSEALRRIAGDEALRARLVERGKDRWPRYSWEASAGALVEACGRVAARASATRGSAADALQGLYHQLMRLHIHVVGRDADQRALKVMKATIEQLDTRLRNQFLRRLLRPVKHAVLRLIGKDQVGKDKPTKAA